MEFKWLWQCPCKNDLCPAIRKAAVDSFPDNGWSRPPGSSDWFAAVRLLSDVPQQYPALPLHPFRPMSQESLRFGRVRFRRRTDT